MLCRHLYWTDWGKKAVYRSNYNGQEISKYLNPESNSKLAAVTLDNNGIVRVVKCWSI